MRCIGQGETAWFVVFLQDIDVLPRKKLQALARRQFEINDHHVVRQFFQLVHTGG